MNLIDQQQKEAHFVWTVELLYRQDGRQPQLGGTSLWNAKLLAVSDQLTKQTITNTLNHILESGLLDEKNMSNEFINNLVYRTPPKDGDIVTHTHVDYSERRGHNQAVKTIREYITKMKQ